MNTKHRALVVEGNPETVRTVGDILDSLNHAHDSAGDQQSARKLLAAGKYAYVLLDLEIPVKRGRLRRIENGKNLLRQIRETAGMENVPVIVMSENGNDGPHLAVSLMKAGATDYVTKPFTDGNLDKAIHTALAKAGHVRATPPRVPNLIVATQDPAGLGFPLDQPKDPQPFTSGEMVFSSKYVRLCGINVLGDTGLGHCRRMLDLLRRKRKDGRFVRISAEEIARRIGKEIHAAVGVGTITGCAKTIRTNIKTRLMRDLNLICEDQDALARDEQGYHLNDDKVTVREIRNNDENVDDPSTVPGDKNVPSNGPANVPSNDYGHGYGHDHGQTERQKWIIEEARKGRMIYRRQVEERFRVSRKTANRDFSELVRHGHIQYVRKPHPGFYRYKGWQNQAV